MLFYIMIEISIFRHLELVTDICAIQQLPVLQQLGHAKTVEWITIGQALTAGSPVNHTSRFMGNECGLCKHPSFK